MPLELWLAFVAASAVLLVIPGPTILSVVSYSVAHGRRGNIPLVAAVALGVLLGRILARGSLMLALRRLVGGPVSAVPLLFMIAGGAAGVTVTRMTAGPFGSIPAAALGCAVALLAAAMVLTRQGDMAFLRSEIRGE